MWCLSWSINWAFLFWADEHFHVRQGRDYTGTSASLNCDGRMKLKLHARVGRSKLILCYIGYTKIVISYRTNISSYKNHCCRDIRLNIQLYLRVPSGSFLSGWDEAGLTDRVRGLAPPSGLKVGLLCRYVPIDALDEKGGFSLLFALQRRCWRLGTLTAVRADFQLGACSPSERAQVQVQPDLDHGGLIIQRKPQVFLTLGF